MGPLGLQPGPFDKLNEGQGAKMDGLMHAFSVIIRDDAHEQCQGDLWTHVGTVRLEHVDPVVQVLGKFLLLFAWWKCKASYGQRG